ncbi:MAG: hypothetical protein U5K28_12900 [Halobacteriales archaeon]|nr:hypothetical protein [Halobacteriales archaeon]
MNLASETRAAVRREPFLHAALAAGVVNYTAAARYLDIGDEEPVAAALRRYAENLSLPEMSERPSPRVDMQSGLGPVDVADALLTVGDQAFGPGGGSLTAITISGEVSASDLAPVLARLGVEDIEIEATGGSDGHLICLVKQSQGVNALRAVEETLDS